MISLDSSEVAPEGMEVSFILALGSNLGDRRAHLAEGLEFLARAITVDSVSRLVESTAWGPLASQPDFLNLVMRGRTDTDVHGLLRLAQDAETNAGRVRTVPKGPRTLDVDLIFYGALRVRSPVLSLPHPHWAERPFVSRLIPEVAGAMVDPDTGRELRELSWEEPLPDGLRFVSPPLRSSVVGGAGR